MIHRILFWGRATKCDTQPLRNLLFCLLLAFAPAATAQVTLNVTDFGAKGDAVHFYVNTVSNSIVVTTTNQFSSADIGKNIQIFGVGKRTYGANSYGVVTNGYQDLIASVTNIVNGTNLFLRVHRQDGTTNYPPSRSLTAWATLGTDNMLAISNCIAAAAGYTNATIYIPKGRYLVMPVFGNANGYALGSIIIKRGGLCFLGESREETVLLGRGAWQSYFGMANGSYPFRGFLFQCVAPITNNLPLIFENFTMDGGVQQGNLEVHGIQCNPVDGLGWDEQHGAYLTYDTVNGGGTAALQVFTNINVVHWRGEAFKSIDQNTNGTIDIQNCLFGDICATALNIYPRWNIRNNVFTNCWQITEYFQKFYRGTAYFCDNLITNSDTLAGYGKGFIGNALSVNGGYWQASPLVIQSNRFYNAGGFGMNIFITTPAANVAFLNNDIRCQPYSQVFNIGAPGAQGTDCNSNILISGNSVYCSGTLTSFVSWGGDGLSAVYNLTVCSNTITAPTGIQHLTWGGHNAYNIRFYNNDASASGPTYIQTGVPGGSSPFYVFETNNLYNVPPTYFDKLTTNTVSYAWGPKIKVDMVKTGSAFIMDDSSSNQIPAGAMMEIDNRTNRWPVNGWGGGDMSGDLKVYFSQKPGVAPITLTNGTKLTFYWNGFAWSTKLAPPSNVRVISK